MKLMSSHFAWGGSATDRYVKYVSRLARDSPEFSVFRREPDYTCIVENVTPEDGEFLFDALDNEYVRQIILDSEPADEIGSASTILIQDRKISPTTIRYGYHISKIIAQFPKFLKVQSICEIGVGYGGMARIICEYHKRCGGSLKSYRMFDLPDVLKLAQRYMSHFELPTHFEYMTLSDVQKINNDTYDFVLSNWAFSELNRNVQMDYILKVVSKARADQMIMNTGLNGSQKAFGKNNKCLSDAEILRMLPNAQISDDPSPKGYVLVFGNELKNNSAKPAYD